jgi:hypothetical protein
MVKLKAEDWEFGTLKKSLRNVYMIPFSICSIAS